MAESISNQVARVCLCHRLFWDKSIFVLLKKLFDPYIFIFSLKRKNIIREKSIENYVKKKKKNILSTLSFCQHCSRCEVKQCLSRFYKSKRIKSTLLYRMGTKYWFSLAKVFYGIRKNKNSDFATLIPNEK